MMLCSPQPSIILESNIVEIQNSTETNGKFQIFPIFSIWFCRNILGSWVALADVDASYVGKTSYAERLLIVKMLVERPPRMSSQISKISPHCVFFNITFISRADVCKKYVRYLGERLPPAPGNYPII